MYYSIRCRPYYHEYTGSLSNSEVKRGKARLVLGSGTAWEPLRVLTAFPLAFNLPARLIFPKPGVLTCTLVPRYQATQDNIMWILFGGFHLLKLERYRED